MNRMGEKLFSCAAFPYNERRLIYLRKLFTAFYDKIHDVAFMDNIIESVFCHMPFFDYLFLEGGFKGVYFGNILEQ